MPTAKSKVVKKEITQENYLEQILPAKLGLESLKIRLNELELRLEDMEKKIKQVAGRMGL